ncbi:hypothetical protein [Zhenhengia yiwuensis]|uniref:Uncharacterized protein n=1 Tax=Zhenhengia yiwuensis TaxID=2763666 RepID=A0A926EIL3_9FIRM|nr:hypothetical protein [Zhenhengia yiwuensis]MBC8581059.1 hypothetical protein [Zhenhengia yiwuensis]
MSSLFNDDEAIAWECIKIAQFTNMSYLEVKALPFDEFIMLKRLAQIEGHTKSEQGMEILKDNIRYMCTSPDVDKLREKYGKEEEHV